MKKLIFALSCLLLAIAAQAEIITIDDDWSVEEYKSSIPSHPPGGFTAPTCAVKH